MVLPEQQPLTRVSNGRTVKSLIWDLGVSCDKHVSGAVHGDSRSDVFVVLRPIVVIGPEWHARVGILDRRVIPITDRITDRLSGHEYVAAAVHRNGIGEVQSVVIAER